MTEWVVKAIRGLCLTQLDTKFTTGPNHTKFCAFWQKMINNFWQIVDAILEDISVTETVVWC